MGADRRALTLRKGGGVGEGEGRVISGNNGYWQWRNRNKVETITRQENMGCACDRSTKDAIFHIKCSSLYGKMDACPTHSALFTALTPSTLVPTHMHVRLHTVWVLKKELPQTYTQTHTSPHAAPHTCMQSHWKLRAWSSRDSACIILSCYKTNGPSITEHYSHREDAAYCIY